MSQTSIAAILAGHGQSPDANVREQTAGSATQPVEPSYAVRALALAREHEELERIRRSVEAAGEVTYHWQIDSDRLSWAGSLASVLEGVEETALATGRDYARLLDRDNAASRYDAVMRSAAVDEGEGAAYCVEYQLRPFGPGDERALWVEDMGRWYAGAEGRPAEAFGIVRRIDERVRRDQRLKFLGTCDPLTGMMNRARLADALSEALAQATRDGTSFGFIIAAVNNLPVVNDAYGFDIADEVMASVGRRLRQVVRTGDSIGRYSGSKFGIILSHCSEPDLAVAAERFLGVARDSVIESERGPVWAMLSIGGIIVPKHASSANVAMALAEEALAEAERQPTDSYVIYKPSAERMTIRTLNARCGAEIVASLREDRFTLAYQPIVRATTGEVAMHEALLRMICQDGDPVAAVHLVPIAEKLGLVRLIDRTVMGLAVNELFRSASARISLNVSGVTATDPRWFGLLTEIIRQHPEVTDRLMIEITETVALNDINHTKLFIDQLRELGCKVAIDDFGAGYTSFRNLQILDVDMVKIDGSFCDKLHANQDNQYFVRSLIDLARKCDLETVAEWVQLEKDAELLREWGIDYLQGNLFGQAMIAPPWEPETRVAADEPFLIEPAVEIRSPIYETDAIALLPTENVESLAEQDANPLPTLEREAETPEIAPIAPDEDDEGSASLPGSDFSRLRAALAALDTLRGPAASR